MCLRDTRGLRERLHTLPAKAGPGPVVELTRGSEEAVASACRTSWSPIVVEVQGTSALTRILTRPRDAGSRSKISCRSPSPPRAQRIWLYTRSTNRQLTPFCLAFNKTISHPTNGASHPALALKLSTARSLTRLRTARVPSWTIRYDCHVHSTCICRCSPNSP